MSELVYGKIDLLNTSLGKITLQYTGTVAKINFVFSQKKSCQYRVFRAETTL